MLDSCDKAVEEDPEQDSDFRIEVEAIETGDICLDLDLSNDDESCDIQGEEAETS